MSLREDQEMHRREFLSDTGKAGAVFLITTQIDTDLLAEEKPQNAESKAAFTVADIRRIVSERMKTVTVSEALKHGLPCIDGRNKESGGGYPGGDAGIETIVMAEAELLLRRKLTPKERDGLIAALPEYYMHTDTHAMEHLLERVNGRTGFGDVTLRELKEYFEGKPVREGLAKEIRDILATDAKCMGCGHEKKMMLEPQDYAVVKELPNQMPAAGKNLPSEVALCSTDRVRHDPTHARIEELEGEHGEMGVVIIKGPDVKMDGSVASMVPADGKGGNQVFVLNLPLARLRTEEVITAALKLIPELKQHEAALREGSLGALASHAMTTATKIATPGISIFEVEYDKDPSTYDVKEVGKIPERKVTQP